MKSSSLSFGLPDGTVDRINEIFAKFQDVEQVVLYGSRAKGNFRSNSDIDLTIRGSDLSWSEFQMIERQLDDLLLPYKIDLSLYDQIDNQALRDHIQRVGKVFYNRSPKNQRETKIE